MLAPTGGPKDTKPPKVTKAEPKKNQTSYHKSYIKLTFDEYVSIDNLNNELIVSPPLKYKPISKISGKTAIISWTDTLIPNTTYTFNFGGSIKDINEGNVYENFTLTFSTGTEIDSAEYSGKIMKTDKAEPLKAAYVYLSNLPITDSTFFSVKALYQTKTNSQGDFHFQGLKPSQYFLYFLEDKNSNKSADNGEYVGFADTQIVVKYPLQVEKADTTLNSFTSSQKNVFLSFPYYTPAKRVFKSISAENSGQIALLWQDQVFSPEIVVKTKSGEPLLALNNRDTLLVFVHHKDSLQIEVQNIKGERLFLSDTIRMLSKPMPLRLFTTPNDIGVRYDSMFKITSNHFIQAIDSSKIWLKYDSVSIQPRVTWNPHEIFVWFQFEEGKKYEITLHDSAIRYQDSIWSSKIAPFKKEIAEQKELSHYELKFKRESMEFNNMALIIEITYNNEKYYRYLKPEDSILTLSNLQSGSYSLKVIADRNENGIWDTGDISTLTQAEKMLIIAQPVEVKKGWDGDAEIVL